MKCKKSWVRWLAITLLVAMVVGVSYAATQQQIDESITKGVAWLAAHQNADGSWGTDYQIADTCFVLTKLQEHAFELGCESPFHPCYVYSQNVIKGWQYIFAEDQAPHEVAMEVQPAGDPDTNGNGYGLAFDQASMHTYYTGICMMALAASRAPDRPNDGGWDFDDNDETDTFKEILQEMVDWMAFAQADSNQYRGGWDYEARNNSGYADQSNAGYAVLGLAYAELPPFNCTVPEWVRTELDLWTVTIQLPDGGAKYAPDTRVTVANELRTGNLIFQMCFNDLPQNDPRFQGALGFIQKNWLAPWQQNVGPGWGYNRIPPAATPDYQAMYCLMKGLVYCGIDTLDIPTLGTVDWFNQQPPASPPWDFASVQVQQQLDDGDWPATCDRGSSTRCTYWAMLTLEQSVPPQLCTMHVASVSMKKRQQNPCCQFVWFSGIIQSEPHWRLEGATVSVQCTAEDGTQKELTDVTNYFGRFRVAFRDGCGHDYHGPEWTCCVTNLVKPGYVYDPLLNHMHPDPPCVTDSTGAVCTP